MEEKLRTLLAENETLLWSGRPEAFTTMDRTYKTSIGIGLVIKGVILAAFLVAYISAAVKTGEVQLGVVAVLLVLGGFALVYPFLTAGHLRKKKVYGFTDRRILRMGENTESVPYSRIRTAALRSDADGHTSLLCGAKTVKLKPSRWRSVADAPFTNRSEDPEAEDIVLYALPMDGKLQSILKQYLPLN